MLGGEYVLEGGDGCSGKKTGRKDDHEGGARGRKVGSKNKVQKKCGFDTKSKRCNRRSMGNMNEWCTVGKKTKRCKKSSLGKQVSPKNPANVTRGKSQMTRLKSQGKWRGRPKKRTAADGPPPLPTHLLRKTRKPIKTVSSGLTCNTMSQKDCQGKGGNLMGCRWGKFGKSTKDTCGQKATASHIGKVKRPGAGRKKKSARTPKKSATKTQQGGAQWNFIVNPETGRKVSINGYVGQRVLQNYTKMM